MTPFVTLLGGGGLLGTAMRGAVRRRGLHGLTFSGLPWGDPETCEAILRAAHEARFAEGGVREAPWLVLWCAGGGNVGADPRAMAAETDLLTRFATMVRDLTEQYRTRTAFSFASSGGAIWSGSSHRVLDEQTPPAPIHPYGRAKLEQEAILRDTLAGDPGIALRCARISNLYGCRPAARPPSGLIGHLVRNALRRTPTSIYVPLDTQRDYVHADHAASLMLGDVVDALDQPAGAPLVDLIASGRSETIAAVVATLERVLTRRVPLTVGYSELAARQPRILAFRSRRRDLARLDPHGLAAGLRHVVDGNLGRPHLA